MKMRKNPRKAKKINRKTYALYGRTDTSKKHGG